MQKLLRPVHREISLNAKCASDVYTSNVSNNRLVLDTTMDAQGLTAAGANVLLHKRVLFPSKRAASGFAKIPVYRFLKRAHTYFYTTVKTTAVKVFVETMHELSGNQIGHSTMPLNAKKARIVLSEADAIALVGDLVLVNNTRAWKSLLAAVSAVLKKMGGGEECEEPSPLPGDDPIVVCRYGHLALVAVKIEQHIKRIANVNAATNGMNQGHRTLYIEWLQRLNFNFDKTAEEQRGVRLIDGDDKDRAVVETEEDDDNLADFGADAEDDDDAAAEDGEADV